MKLQFFKKLVAFIMTVMMFSIFPSLLEAQPPCHNGVCPAGYYCSNGHCVKLSLPCNCNKRPIPQECGQICGWYTDPTNEDNLISMADGSVISSEINFEEIENVSFKIYDLTGKLIKAVADAAMLENEQQSAWDKTDANGNMVSPGLYILQPGRTVGSTSERRLIAVN